MSKKRTSSNLSSYKPNISEEIMSHLLFGKSAYRQKKFLWEMVRRRVNVRRQNYYQNLYRLSKRGYVTAKGEGYILTTEGKSAYSNPYRLIRTKAEAKKKIVVIFDIPEPKKKIREWLRGQLKWWDFKMVQKSVWIGNGPLPVEFKKRLKDLGIGKSVLIFSIKSEKQFN